MQRLRSAALAAALIVSVASSAARSQTDRTSNSAGPSAASRPSAPKSSSASHTAVVKGNARTGANGPLPHATVRLRNVRSGQLADTMISNDAGEFEFRGIEPGSYVVEILGPDRSVIAASQIVDANAGETVTALVRMPYGMSPLANILGHSQGSAAAVISAAAASQILSALVTTATSPPSGSR